MEIKYIDNYEDLYGVLKKICLNAEDGIHSGLFSRESKELVDYMLERDLIFEKDSRYFPTIHGYSMFKEARGDLGRSIERFLRKHRKFP